MLIKGQGYTDKVDDSKRYVGNEIIHLKNKEKFNTIKEYIKELKCRNHLRQIAKANEPKQSPSRDKGQLRKSYLVKP